MFLHSMVEQNMMEKEFRAYRTRDRRRVTFFARQREMDREEYCQVKIPQCQETPITASKHGNNWIPLAVNGW
jgi:hypothetical protein